MVLRDQGRKRSRTGARRGYSSRIPFQAKRGIAGRQEGGKAGRPEGSRTAKRFRSCYEINYTDCAGWFFEIKEENAAVPGYGEAF